MTQCDAYPLPQIDATLVSLAGSKLFSTSDLAAGYWQVEVEEEDNKKIVFSTMQGQCNAFWAHKCPCHIPAIDGVYLS